MELDELKNLNSVEKIQAMEALWESLNYSSQHIESPDWHKGVLEQRRKFLEKGEAKFISLKELKALKNT